MDEIEKHDVLAEMGCVYDISIGTADPHSYTEEMASHLNQKDGMKRFGDVCSFIVNKSEKSFTIEASVKKQYHSKASDLVIALGAHKVNSY